LDLQERIYVSYLSFLRSRSRKNKIEANEKDGYWNRGYDHWDWDAALPCYAAPHYSCLPHNLGIRNLVALSCGPAHLTNAITSTSDHSPLAANRPSSNRTISHPPAEKADRAQQTSQANRIVGPRGWGFPYASLQGTSRAIDWSSVCKWTGLE
jgi:hypothetical protein